MSEPGAQPDWPGLDPDLAAIARAAATRPPLFDAPGEARRMMDEVAVAMARTAPPIEILSAEDHLATAGDRAVPVRVYQPNEGGGVVALFYHGGGYAVGSVRQSDRIARKLCRDTKAVIVSVEYRLAPEHPFPAAHDDARIAALWAHHHRVQLSGGDGPIALIGESAGANLAAAAAISLRDGQVDLLAQVLIAAGVDFARDRAALGPIDGRFPMLNYEDLQRITELYVQDPAVPLDRCPPSPMRAASLAGLPPTLVVVPGFCPLQEESRRYAQRLAAAGVPVSVLELADMFHPFLGFFDQAPAAMRANDRLCDAITTLFGDAARSSIAGRSYPGSSMETPESFGL